jgi:hypothetical protein
MALSEADLVEVGPMGSAAARERRTDKRSVQPIQDPRE